MGGKEFDVLYTEYAFSRDTDKKGKVSSNVYGGRVTFEVESTEDTSVIEAMLNSQFMKVLVIILGCRRIVLKHCTNGL